MNAEMLVTESCGVWKAMAGGKNGHLIKVTSRAGESEVIEAFRKKYYSTYVVEPFAQQFRPMLSRNGRITHYKVYTLRWTGEKS